MRSQYARYSSTIQAANATGIPTSDCSISLVSFLRGSGCTRNICWRGASAVQRLTEMADQVVTMDGGRPVAWATVVVTTRAIALTSVTPGDFIRAS